MKTLCFAAVLSAGLSFSVYAATTNVTTVADLIAAVRDASANDEIVVMASGSPYEFSADQKDVVGHLYARVAITLRGETGNPEDVVLVGNANRILYLHQRGNTIRGLTFRNGDCSGYEKRSEEPYDQMRGGAIHLRCGNSSSDSTTEIRNCIFESCKSNQGGGACAIYNHSTGIGGKFYDCVFDGNSTLTTGGGAVFRAASMKNCAIKNNYSNTANGGALFGVPEVVGCTIVSNATSSSSGFGGGVFECTLTGCYVASNYAYRCGAAADSKFYSCTNEANSAGNYSEFGAKSTGCYAEGCRFVNVGTLGLRIFGSSGFSRCRFNKGSFVSGSYAFSQWCAMTNCLVANNSGFRFFDGLTSASAMVNCSIVSNAYTMASGSSQVLIVENCLFNGNQIGVNFIDVNDKTPSFTLAFNNCILSAASDAHAPGSGNYNYYSERATFKPGFAGAEKNSENPFAITRRSPAFSKAGAVEDWMATATDIRGEGFPRLRDGVVNIGCYQCWDVIPGMSVIVR